MLNDRLPRSEALKLDAFFEVSNKLRRQVREHRHSAKVILERAAAVGLVELRAKRLVLKHDVQNVAQHLVGNNVGLRDDRGGPRIEIHARHFAEQITRTEFGDGVAVGEVHGSVNRNGAVASFFFALIFFAANERAGQPVEEPFRASLRLDVRDGCGNRNFGPAFDDVKRGGTKFAFAANHLALAEVPIYDGATIQLQKRPGNALENRYLQKFFRLKNLRARTAGDCRSSKTFVGERTRGAGNHAFPAGNARGVAHRCVQVEGDPRGITLSHPPEDEIIFDFVAAANAAVTEDTSIMIDGDGERGIVTAASHGSLRKTRLTDARGFRKRFEFAITGLFLPRARRRMIGHQQLKQSLAHIQNLFRVSDHFHARFHRTHAGGGEYTRAGIHNAQTANAHGSLVLQVAQGGNADTVYARSIENGCSVRHAHGFPVNADLDHPRWCDGGGHVRGEFPRAALLRRAMPQ